VDTLLPAASTLLADSILKQYETDWNVARQQALQRQGRRIHTLDGNHALDGRV
jgi:hypothetical protein